MICSKTALVLLCLSSHPSSVQHNILIEQTPNQRLWDAFGTSSTNFANPMAAKSYVLHVGQFFNHKSTLTHTPHDLPLAELWPSPRWPCQINIHTPTPDTPSHLCVQPALDRFLPMHIHQLLLALPSQQ